MILKDMTETETRNRRVLVVDDDRLLCHAIKVAMGLDGYNAEFAANMAEALHMLEHGEFDLVLADYVLPDGDGEALAHDIRERKQCRFIILMSGYLDESSSKDVDLFLHKPFDLRSLRGEIGRILGENARN
jgi:DNA-binding response OmpR family regulator